MKILNVFYYKCSQIITITFSSLPSSKPDTYKAFVSSFGSVFISTDAPAFKAADEEEGCTGTDEGVMVLAVCDWRLGKKANKTSIKKEQMHLEKLNYSSRKTVIKIIF